MDFTFTDEQKQLRNSVREFAERLARGDGCGEKRIKPRPLVRDPARQMLRPDRSGRDDSEL